MDLQCPSKHTCSPPPVRFRPHVHALTERLKQQLIGYHKYSFGQRNRRCPRPVVLNALDGIDADTGVQRAIDYAYLISLIKYPSEGYGA